MPRNGNSIKRQGSPYPIPGPRLCPQGKNWELPERKLVHGRGEVGWVKKDVSSASFLHMLLLLLCFCFLQRGRKCGSAAVRKRVHQERTNRVRMQDAGRVEPGGRWAFGERKCRRDGHCFQWECQEPWQSWPRPVLKWNSDWSLFQGTSYHALTKHDHHHLKLTDICLTSPPSFPLSVSCLRETWHYQQNQSFLLGKSKKKKRHFSP